MAILKSKINRSASSEPANYQTKLFILGSIGVCVLVFVILVGGVLFLLSGPDDTVSDNQSFINKENYLIEIKEERKSNLLIDSVPAKPLLTKPTVSFIDPQLGPKDAPVTIWEFADFNCEYCASVQSVLAEVLKKYPNKIRLVFKNLPIPKIHPSAKLASEAALCAQKQGKFWEYHDLLFAKQDYFTTDMLTDFARDLNLSVSSFTNCLESGETIPVIDKSVQEASELKIDGTPHFYINDQEVSGASDISEFTDIIDIELKKINQ